MLGGSCHTSMWALDVLFQYDEETQFACSFHIHILDILDAGAIQFLFDDWFLLPTLQPPGDQSPGLELPGDHPSSEHSSLEPSPERQSEEEQSLEEHS